MISALGSLGLDPETESRSLTVNGGLTFFGGLGNKYSMHGIASTIERIRDNKNDYGLVLANGGWMSKEAAGVYSSSRYSQRWPRDRTFT